MKDASADKRPSVCLWVFVGTALKVPVYLANCTACICAVQSLPAFWRFSRRRLGNARQGLLAKHGNFVLGLPVRVSCVFRGWAAALHACFYAVCSPGGEEVPCHKVLSDRMHACHAHGTWQVHAHMDACPAGLFTQLAQKCGSWTVAVLCFEVTKLCWAGLGMHAIHSCRCMPHASCTYAMDVMRYLSMLVVLPAWPADAQLLLQCRSSMSG
jgi:hypothetical protein